MAAIDIDHRHKQSPQPAATDTTGRKEPRSSRPTVPRITVDGVVIDRKAIAAEMQNHPGDDAAEALREAATALIVREVLLGEARRLGIVAAPEADAEGRRETEEDALIRQLMAAEVPVPSADEETLRRYYDNNRRRFVTPPLYAASHILLAARRDDETGFAAARDKAAALRSNLSDSHIALPSLRNLCPIVPRPRLAARSGKSALVKRRRNSKPRCPRFRQKSSRTRLRRAMGST